MTSAEIIAVVQGWKSGKPIEQRCKRTEPREVWFNEFKKDGSAAWLGSTPYLLKATAEASASSTDQVADYVRSVHFREVLDD